MSDGKRQTETTDYYWKRRARDGEAAMFAAIVVLLIMWVLRHV